MKKIIITLFLLLFTSCAFADFLPHNIRSVKHYGIGVLNETKPFKIYKEPNLDSEIINEINPVQDKQSAVLFSSNEMIKLRQTFIAYRPSKNISLLVVENSDEGEWYEVVIDQRTGKTGYINEPESKNFYTWKGLFYSYGKDIGIKFMHGLDKKYKSVYAKDSFDSQIVASLEYPTQIKFSIIRGNWMLATIKEFDGRTKIGWINWRNDDGSLNVFPQF